MCRVFSQSKEVSTGEGVMKAYVVYDTVAREVLAVFSTEYAAQDLCGALHQAGEARHEINVYSTYVYDE